MGNNDKWIVIKTPKDALEWFKKDPKFVSKYRKTVDCKMPEKFSLHNEPEGYYSGLSNFEHDSCPKAWVHFNKQYTPESFGKCNNKIFKYYSAKYQSENAQNYRLSWLGYEYVSKEKFNKLCAIPIGYSTVVEQYKTEKEKFELELTSRKSGEWERLSGDCDFNFNEGKCSRFVKCILGLSSNDKVDFKWIFDHPENDEIKLLYQCYNMHHTMLNFSLVQGSGNLQAIKQNCDADRLDCFLYLLDSYYKNEPTGKEKIESRKSNKNNRLHYLNQFSKDSNNKEIPKDERIYNYCAKIYFLPTEFYPTGKMIEMGVKDGYEKWETDWKPLLERNKDLIDELIKSGKELLDSYVRVIHYMCLAVRFWQAKERYFELMDKIIDSKTAE